VFTTVKIITEKRVKKGILKNLKMCPKVGSEKYVIFRIFWIE